MWYGVVWCSVCVGKEGVVRCMLGRWCGVV